MLQPQRKSSIEHDCLTTV